MMAVILSILGIVLTIFFVVGTHEAAHFLAARALGVKVLTFSIGFGKTLLRWHDKSGTEYILALVPLGGYVRMLDEREGYVEPKQRAVAFNTQAFYKKFLIVLAGPFSNLFCAFVLYWLIFMIGFITIKPIIGSVDEGSIAAKAGLKAKQEIIAIDGRDAASWTSILFRLLIHLGNKEHISISTMTPNQHTVQLHQLDLQQWQVDPLKPDPLAAIGITPYQPPIPLIIGIINPDSAAARAGLKIGDTIHSLDGKKVTQWSDFVTYVYQHPGKAIELKITRNNKIMTIPVTIASKRTLFLQEYGQLGIGPRFEWPANMLLHVQYGPLTAISHAWHEVWDLSQLNLILLGKMVTGKLSVQSLGGPITIFETASDAFSAGLLAFLGFLAFISIAIGIINLLPIPGLDGCHLFIQIIEAIIRRPIPEKYLVIAFKAGFTFIFFILLLSLVNDLLRLY